MENNPPPLTKKQLSEKINVSESWIEKRLHEIPHFKIHHLVRFDLAEVREWLSQFKRGGEDAE